MAIFLFSDFGASDLYVGQVEAVLDRYAPGVRVIHLLNEAPRFDPRASAHLLAALAAGLGRGHVVLGVVDPGVGTDRAGVVARIDGRWFVGPDNGLFSVAAARAAARGYWRIVRTPPGVAATFHGRDVFAPLAAAIAAGDFPNENVAPVSALAVEFGGEERAEVIYVDHYGNAWTGLRGKGRARDRLLVVAGHTLAHAHVFGEAPAGTAFWYENSSGLVEVAVNRGSAASVLGLAVGTPVAWA